jgi:methionyl-tRNA synthetase
MTYYLTTPIYYVNSEPHVGHAYTTIAADIVVRHLRQRGEDVFFLTGTDEHASKVYRVAEQQGLSAKEYVDRIVEESWRKLPARVGVEHDFFIRTTDPEHKAFVQDFVQRIHDSGHIYEGTYVGLYCVGCEEYKNEAELVDGKCPIHETEPEPLEERNWFFRLSAFQERLLALYDERPDFVAPSFRCNEARSIIEGGLEDFSLSRQGQPWGVPIPWDPEQVTWVWVDALINYLSALTYARPGEDLRDRYWPEVRHLIGKDILRLHCVLWPALLLGAGYTVPKQIFAHGYLTLGDRKMSKSLGNVIPLDLVDEFGIDAVRFWAIRTVSFGQDGNVTLESVRERYERELGNDLGNLLSRTTAMIARYREGRVRACASDGSPVAALLSDLAEDVASRIDRFDLSGALEQIWQVVRGLNRYVESRAPWQLAKDDARAEELDRTLYDLADGLRAVAVALAAFVPETSARILEALRSDPAGSSWDGVAYGRTGDLDGIEPAAPLFPRIDAPTAAA